MYASIPTKITAQFLAKVKVLHNSNVIANNKIVFKEYIFFFFFFKSNNQRNLKKSALNATELDILLSHFLNTWATIMAVHRVLLD